MNTAQEVATDIARELRAAPNMWCQYLYGNKSFPRCIVGHIFSRVKAQPERDATYNKFVAIADAQKGALSYWNDTPGRTVEEVIALCDRVAVSA